MMTVEDRRNKKVEMSFFNGEAIGQSCRCLCQLNFGTSSFFG